MNGIIHLLNEYGYIAIFISLMLELICIPIPNEALLSYVGILAFKGKMNLFLSIFFAGMGGIIGVTISYWIGYKLGAPFFRKFGHYIHMGPEKMERIAKWYGKYGKVLLIFSYFVPGIRHIASIISGIIHLPFRSFCFFSYIGVYLWVSTFVFLGFILGPEWDKYQVEIKKWLLLISILICIGLICYFVIKANKDYLKESILLLFKSFFKRYKSFLRIKLYIVCVFIIFVSLFTFMIGLIQDFVAQEFNHFNTISRTIIFSLFNDNWRSLMNHLYTLSSWTALGIVFIFTVLIIFINNKNRWLELLFLTIIVVGSFLFSSGLRWVFHYMLSGNTVSSDFPDMNSVTFVTFYGALLLMFLRHQRNYIFGGILLFVLIFILLSFSICNVYLYHINPSDLVAGYVFGAAWVTGMAFTLELFRFVSLLKNDYKTS